MFYMYHSRSLFRRIARELDVSVYFQNSGREITRRQELCKDINIGCTRVVFDNPNVVLNADISIALSKVKSFQAFDEADLRHPPLFTTVKEAMRWPHGWLGRRDGLSGGKGISVFQTEQEPLQAAQFDFMVGIIPGKAEYRIHVGRVGKKYSILATQQKIGIKDHPEVVRNYESGVTYSTQPLKMSEKGQEKANTWAIAAVEACGLDFGAVDLLQSTDGKLYVLEVNTAPGIRSRPIYNAYLNYFRQFVKR